MFLKVITIFLDAKTSSSQPTSVSPEGFPSCCLQRPDEILICQAEIRSRHVCSELKAGDAQYDLSPWQIKPHYFHAIPRTGLPHAAKCSTAEITGREIKPVPQWKTDYIFWYPSTDEKGTLLGMLHLLYKMLRHWAFHSQLMNASSQTAKKILGGKNPSI